MSQSFGATTRHLLSVIDTDFFPEQFHSTMVRSYPYSRSPSWRYSTGETIHLFGYKVLECLSANAGWANQDSYHIADWGLWR